MRSLLAALIRFSSLPSRCVAQVPPSEASCASIAGLHAAAATGDVAEIERLIAARREAQGHRRATAARRCMSRSSRTSMTAARALLRLGADPNALEFDRYDIITIAAVANDLADAEDRARGRRQSARTSPAAMTAPR